MAKGKLVLAATAIAAVSLSAFAGTSRAVTYIEGPDAGQTLATAKIAGAATGFSGTIGAAQDADLYQFTIAAGTYLFSDVNATTDASVGPGVSLDTAIFLFDSTGKAIATNDDAAGSNDVTSAMRVTLTAGTYYFGISLSGNEPVNSNNQLLFVGYPGGDTTATRGPASGVNPKTEANFNGQSYSTDVGTYNVFITPAAVPEPSTWVTVAASVGALAFLRRRRAA